MKNYYAKAVTALIKEGKKVDEVVKHLKAVMEKRGHTKLLPSVLATAKRSLTSGYQPSQATVIVDNEGSYKTQKKEIAESLKELNTEEPKPLVKVDDTLIGGYIALVNNKQIDESYKSKLVKIYKNTQSNY